MVKKSAAGLHDVYVPKLFGLKQARLFLRGVYIPGTSVSGKAIFEQFFLHLLIRQAQTTPIPKSTSFFAIISK